MDMAYGRRMTKQRHPNIHQDLECNIKCGILERMDEKFMSTKIMAPRKNKCNKAGMAIAQAIINEYQPQTAEYVQAAIEDVFGPMFESLLQGEKKLSTPVSGK